MGVHSYSPFQLCYKGGDDKDRTSKVWPLCTTYINAAKRAAGSQAVPVEYQTRRVAEAKGRDLPESLGAGQCTGEARQPMRGGGS